MKPWFFPTVLSCSLIFMCVPLKTQHTFGFCITCMFYNGSCKMSQENKMRICKYVHPSGQSNELGGGWHFWSNNGIFSFILRHSVCCLIAQHSENWKRGKNNTKTKPQQQPLFSGKWHQKLMAWNFCPRTTKPQIVGLIITRRQLRPSFDHSLPCFIRLKN